MRDLEVFGQAIEIQDTDKRRRFVDAACGSNAGLRTEIFRLLAAYDQAGELLEQSAAADHLAQGSVARAVVARRDRRTRVTEHSTTPSENETNLPRGFEPSIGLYRLTELISESDWAWVFLAEPPAPACRRIALKVIKSDRDSQAVMERFAVERDVLARMDHPNIATTLDGGLTPQGLPYFVMELVRGVPITAYCDHTRCDITERLQHFVIACRAIHYAHQKGVIHHAIRPGNVRVPWPGGEPIVKVMDLGIARAIHEPLGESTERMHRSARIEALSYRSPEQLERSGLDVDTRSDIYSLGVLLYELVTGIPPFALSPSGHATVDDVCRIIRNEELTRPSLRFAQLGQDAAAIAELRRSSPKKLRSILRGDLDLIIMKALAKDRDQRYGSAIGLANDVSHFLTGDVVTVRRPSWGDITSRFVRRNRGLSIATGLIVGLLLTGIAVSLALAIWAWYVRASSQG